MTVLENKRLRKFKHVETAPYHCYNKNVKFFSLFDYTPSHISEQNICLSIDLFKYNRAVWVIGGRFLTKLYQSAFIIGIQFNYQHTISQFLQAIRPNFFFVRLRSNSRHTKCKQSLKRHRTVRNWPPLPGANLAPIEYFLFSKETTVTTIRWQ